MQVGDTVMLIGSIYDGREVTLVREVGEVQSNAGVVRGFAVRGLTTPSGTMSSFWDDEMLLIERGEYAEV